MTSTRAACLTGFAFSMFIGLGGARADTLQVPQGLAAIPLASDHVPCGTLPDGWQLSDDKRRLRPPPTIAPGESIELTVAADAKACAASKSKLVVAIIAPWPEIDRTAVTWFVDEGRLELKGTQLDRLQVLWPSADGTEQRETCAITTAVGGTRICAIAVAHTLPVSTAFRFLPAYAKDGPGTILLDGRGQPADLVTLTLKPARVVLGQVFAATDSLDISQGVGTVALAHPGSVAWTDCGAAACEIGPDGIIVRNVPASVSQLSITAKLAPRFSFTRAGKSESSATASFTLLRCPLAVVSGPPVRGAEQPQILVKMAGKCRTGAALQWAIAGEPAEVVRQSYGGDGDYVLLRTGELAGGRVTITAARSDSVGGIIGSITLDTAQAPRPLCTLELPGNGPINFIPTNREAVLTVAGVANGQLVPLDLPGVYTVRVEKDRVSLRGNHNGGGFTNLRFAYRRDDLPKAFTDENLAIVTETVQRPLHEASVPVSFTGSATHKDPLAEFLCADKHGNAVAFPPGKPERIAFVARETCRVVIHQERLRPEDGQQEIVLDMDVTKPSGGKRSEASVSERMVLRPGGDPRIFYVKGAAEQFDQITVRLSHVVDEDRYVLGPSGKQTPPSAQWSVTIEGGLLRLYVSLNVPAGLYRINAPAASLTLNFGVLGRITWLDRQGKEGLLGIETGVLGASLIPQQQGTNPSYPPTLVTLLGVGLRVEVGPSAAVGVHLWGAYEFRGEYNYTASDGGPRTASHWSLLFGPSISIGNIGTNL